MYQLYIDYFRWLCQLHPSLLHTDAQRVFEVVSVDEALGDFKGKVSNTGFYFRLIDYTWGVSENGDYQFKQKQCGFIIGKRVSSRNDVAVGKVIARNQCETIIDDFVAHILADSQAGHPLFGNGNDTIDSLKLNVQPLLTTGDGTYDGAICTFVLFPPKEYSLDCHPVPAWQQLSPTIYDGTPPDTDYGGFWQLNDGGNWQGNN